MFRVIFRVRNSVGTIHEEDTKGHKENPPALCLLCLRCAFCGKVIKPLRQAASGIHPAHYLRISLEIIICWISEVPS
jgi:hypothetical protein